MARQIYAFQVSVPAGTAKTSPQTTRLALPGLSVDVVEVRVPPGPSGQVGFALAIAGQVVIPYNAGQWVVADDEPMSWPLDDFPDSGAWSLVAYNVGAYPHTLYVRFLLAPPMQVLSLPPVPIPAPLLLGGA